MGLTQNETADLGIRNSPRLQWKKGGLRNDMRRPQAAFESAFRNPQSAFTLTELLVVVTIIAILAGLITGAAVNALNKAKQARITLEAQQLGNAMADFKNDFGAYPPNVFPNGSSTLSLSNVEQNSNRQRLLRALRKSFSRSTEFNIANPQDPWDDNVSIIANVGLSPAEALVFWLQGFSSDPARPLSGTDLVVTQIDDNGTTINNVITIDSFQPRFDFDKGRLRISRDGSNPSQRRFLTVQRPGDNTDYQIQLYEYLPAGSNEPYVYFDTSRETPLQTVNNWETTEFFYSSPRADPNDPQNIYPLKRLKENVPQPNDRVTPLLQYAEYVEQGKFQILHCGLDDIWGNFSRNGSAGELDVDDDEFIPKLLFPEGPFIGDIADTVCSFLTGTLEDEQE